MRVYRALDTQHVTCSEQNTVFAECAERGVELNTNVPEGDIQQHQYKVNRWIYIYIFNSLQ